MATASPTDGEATAAVNNEGWNLPTDAFVEILLRLSPSRRRLVRFVCRHWRDVIDERTPPIPPPKVLAFFSTRTSASAYVVDDLAGGRGREVWGVSILPGTNTYIDIAMVGTCNGLLCLCDNTKPGGAVALFNPAIDKKLRIPALPYSYPQGKGYRTYRQNKIYHRIWETYTFGYDATTGLYKILHLPCREDVTGGFNALQAFTLGDASWRDVAVPGGTSCCLDAGLVSIGGAAYWVTNGLEKVVCFDLKDERVVFDAPLPVGGGQIHLTEVDGRLGLAVLADMGAPVTTEEVWVLGDRQGWTRRYRVREHGVEQQRLAAPYFAVHGGEHILATRTDERRRKHLRAHRLPEAGIWLPRGEVRSVRISEPGTVVASDKSSYPYLRTFAYVETTEPLSPYKIRRRRIH